MYITDFGFNGDTLSGHGFMVGSVNGPSDTVTIGSELTLNTVKNENSQRNTLTTSSYSDVVTAQFGIVKDACVDGSEYEISDVEIRDLVSWLQQRSYKKFQPVYDDGSFGGIFFMGTFTNITATKSGGKVVELDLTFTSNSPFGYDIEHFEESDSPMTVYSDNDEVGCFYPTKFVVTCKSAGTVHITNSAEEDRYTEVSNCVADEVLTFDCENKIITSSVDHAKLPNDFNYVFPRIVRTGDSPVTVNTFTDSLGSKMSVEYYPIRKVGVFS